MVSKNRLKFSRYYKCSNLTLSLIVISLILSSCTNGIDDLGWKAYKIPAASMAPTLIQGDHILVNLRFYQNQTPQRGDIIVFQYPEDTTKDFVKRVIAVGGDVIQGEKKWIYLNGEILEERYAQYSKDDMNDNTNKFGPLTVPEGKVFVLGDNRDHSYDSRHFGPVDLKAIRGKVFYIYWSRDFGRMFTKIE